LIFYPDPTQVGSSIFLYPAVPVRKPEKANHALLLFLPA
jgi:hypothetical protein